MNKEEKHKLLLKLGNNLQAASYYCYEQAKDAGWYTDLNTGQPKERNLGEMLALIHSEISEALEAERKGLMDDKLPHRLGVEVELADAIIRILDYAGYRNLDLGKAFVEKMIFNKNREDHKLQNRKENNGKKF